MTDSYDQYADQLLNSAFQNARKTPAVNTSHEDQLLNQLFQNVRLSNGIPAPATPSPMFGNNNEWFLLQQLQQQKMLLERQQQMMSPSLFHQAPVQSTSSITEVPTMAEEIPVAAPTKKIARVPVNTEPQQVVLDDAAPQFEQQQPAVTSLNNVNAPSPPLNKKKTFLRSLSMNRKKEFGTAAAIATTATAAKSIQHQYNERKKEEQERKKAEKNAAKFAAATASVTKREEPEVVYESAPQPKYVDRSPSFWKPREERPKGWWKGKRGTDNQQSDYEEVEYEEAEESEEEEEEVVPVVVEPPKKTKKKVVIKRVAVPKQVSSIKASKPKRPMAFKQPTPRKSKPEKKKSNKKGSKNSTSNSFSAVATTAQPMYVMPQQMYQPTYYQQPMMMAPQYMPGSYYPQMMGGVSMPQQTSQLERKTSPPARKKSVYNPRDNSNDKCSIM